MNALAASVASACQIPLSTVETSNKLHDYILLGMRSEASGATDNNTTVVVESKNDDSQSDADEEDLIPGYKMRLEFQNDVKYETKHAPNYNTWYITTHKEAARCAAFSPDGRFIATGSEDTSLKILDVTKMNLRSDAEDKPVIRTLYDHLQPVTEVAFHPNNLMLASCALDNNIKLYDLTKVGVKKAFRYLLDSHPFRSISFHPSGDFLLAGTEDDRVRMYDIKTITSFVPLDSSRNHKGPITSVRFGPNGRLFVTSGEDGSIRIWDGVNMRCERVIEGAHNGHEVCSVRISKNGKYLLSSGKDSEPKLWDLGSGKVIQKYIGATQNNFPIQVAFDYAEDFVLGGDEPSSSIFVWDTKTGEVVKKLSGHNSVASYIASSPVEGCFISCSEDHRARYWKIGDLEA
ncbi:WD40 repeat-like protein [Rozella allomycis CSF55]|uniref:Cleavage stimulation factor 50 kDa subunit n=1 Tax=Rozella allomycis (strain CSF55) TaxID=988480 RepID=A0A075ATU3_ROZAC|nr:hypothetical protein O9G_000492 [Rozella allomycis CSF55]RKP21451.1 WD40 repeat-like protein [Rozella allomycis CSF55]|eukprot:EPZ33716.1 hypothetical protein O9G_000492 [Rozella allomycis CSF55]